MWSREGNLLGAHIHTCTHTTENLKKDAQTAIVKGGFGGFGVSVVLSGALVVDCV